MLIYYWRLGGWANVTIIDESMIHMILSFYSSREESQS